MSKVNRDKAQGNCLCCGRQVGNQIANDDKCPHDETGSGHNNASDDGVQSNIPIDEGWAWVICAACFMMTFVMSLYDQVLAVLLVEVVDKFDVPVPTAVVVFTIFSFTFSAGSVVSTNVLVPRFGVRVVIVISAIVNCASTLVIAVSTNIVFYLTIHVFKGLALGSMWIPSLGLLGHYFKRRRSLATSLTNSGISVALLVAPPFIRLLFNNYGFLGSLLIISGIEMHAIAMAMLLRPPSQYRCRLNKVQSDLRNCHNQREQCSLLEKMEVQYHQADCGIVLPHISRSCDQQESKYSLKHSSREENVDDEHKEQEFNEAYIYEQDNIDRDRKQPEKSEPDNNVQENMDREHKQHIQTEPDNNVQETIDREHNPLVYAEPDNSEQESSVIVSQYNHPISKNTASNYKPPNADIRINEHDVLLLPPSCQEIDGNQTACNQTNLDTEQSVLLPNRLNGQENKTAIDAEIKNNLNADNKSVIIEREMVGEVQFVQEKTSLGLDNKSTRWWSFLLRFFDVDLFSDWLMRLLMASTVFGALLLYIPSYIPTLADRRGVDKIYGAVLLTVCGGVNLCSCVFQGILIDCKLISASRFIGISQVVVGSMCHLVRLFTTFPTLLLLSISQGMFGGARLSLMPILAMDYVGVKNLSKALGFNAMVGTLSLSLHHPFLGYLLHVTNDFNVTFHYVGFALYVSAALLLLENAGRRLNARRHIRRISQ